MAQKIKYNNVSYDILDAIPVNNFEYLIISNPDNLMDIVYVEKYNSEDGIKYFLPPTSFKLEDHHQVDLKRLQINIIINEIIKIIKKEIERDNINSREDIFNQINNVKVFLNTDSVIKEILSDNRNLTEQNFEVFSDYVRKYLNIQLLNKKELKEEFDSKKIKTSQGLNYEWLYNLNSDELKEIAKDKNRTSEELIYILDALDKRLKTEQAIEHYTNSGYTKTKKIDNKSAFIDTLLLIFITLSFGFILLISVF